MGQLPQAPFHPNTQQPAENLGEEGKVCYLFSQSGQAQDMFGFFLQNTYLVKEHFLCQSCMEEKGRKPPSTESKSSGTCEKKISFVDPGWLELCNTFQMACNVRCVRCRSGAVLPVVTHTCGFVLSKEASAVIILCGTIP